MFTSLKILPFRICGLAVGAATLLPLVQISPAATVFTDEASFVSQLQAGFYLETFEGSLLGTKPNPSSFSMNGFSYQISASQGLLLVDTVDFAAGRFFESQVSNTSMQIDFTTGNVTAFGGRFLRTNINDTPVTTNVKLTLNDGTIETIPTTDMPPFPFRGFATDAPTFITTVTISSSGLNSFNTIDDIYVGHNVPEPSAVVLAVLGLASLSLFGWHRLPTRQGSSFERSSRTAQPMKACRIGGCSRSAIGTRQ